ncbi:retinitis pigmentosa 1-like 1 protein [Alosa sapidissima]|uniref:retinitis pigmentosa 1-like 1 protein n=1 Tax=Alosa sapidissima TaxID=34773 RepID=UPI001C0815DA|nr:retinitis pigmentosa 1-like 1 protein [Alosa sapidissima]
MAALKRSYHCFDAIVDDPSRKPSRQPVPPQSTRQETLEDGNAGGGGCNTCQSGAQAEAGGGGQASSSQQAEMQQQPPAPRRPTRPEEGAGEGPREHHFQRHSKRIMLVKNSDPSVRKTIVLHRRAVRSLGVFLDEVAELMQCHVRKLCTMEGHKIDSVQSLLLCPSVLVVVGREPFHSLLLDSIQKNSDDKLPPVNTKSRVNLCTQGLDDRKNFNFGLETKKSIIHPRPESSNRASRLSLSSERSSSNGLHNAGHPGPCPHTRESMMDDDIEKRVLVNKDGSLSMEMKVRFRLLNDETLHWSTEIKKTAGPNTNPYYMGYHEPCYLHHESAESCSEESMSVGDAEEAYTKFYQQHLEEPHCPHCCSQCQEYDIWKNPTVDQETGRRIRSSSSSTSACVIVCKKESVESIRTMSRSSEEFTEHIVEKATCVKQTVEEKYVTCTCQASEVSENTEEKHDSPENTQASDNDVDKSDESCKSGSTSPSKDSQKDAVSVHITQVSDEEDRSTSAVSNSSQVLASLKEDQDDEEDDLPPSVSRASSCSQSNDSDEDLTVASAAPSSCSNMIYLKGQRFQLNLKVEKLKNH